MNRYLYILFILIAVLLLSYFIRQPYIGRCAASPESAMDISIANNYIRGKNLTLSIKETYQNDLPVCRPAVGERGLFYPLLLSFVLKRNIGLQWINIIISIFNSLLFFFILRGAFGDKVAWLSLLWFLFHPRINLAASYLWNFSLVLMFIFLSSLVVVYITNLWGKLFAGSILGLSFWTEPWCLFSAIAFIPGIWLSEKQKAQKILSCVMFLVGFLFVCIPLFFMIGEVHQSPFPPQLGIFFQVRDYDEYLWQSYQYPLPGIASFVFKNFSWIIGKFFKNLVFYFEKSFIIHKTWILLLCLPVLALAGKSAYYEFPRQYLPLLSFSIFSLVGISLVWSRQEIIQNPTFILIFLIPPLFYFTEKFKIKDFPASFLVSVLIITLIMNSYLPFNRGKVAYELEMNNLATVRLPVTPNEIYIANATRQFHRIAAIYPWNLYLKTGRECGLLPVNLPPFKLRQFTLKFSYDYILDNDEGYKSSLFYKNIEGRIPQWMEAIQFKLWKARKQ